MLGIIDKNLKPKKPKIYLCMPDKTRIALLKNILNERVRYRFNDIHEFSCEIPYKIEKKGKIVDNDYVTKIRGRYLLEVDGEYFIIDKFEKSFQSNKEYLKVEAKHLAYEIRDKDVRFLEGVYNLREALDLTVLRDTNWRVSYMDADLELSYRTFNVNSQTQLQFLFETLKKFKAIVYFNSKNRTMAFYKSSSIAIDRGMRVSDKKYLTEVLDSTDMENVCTRLRVYGQDGMGINAVNPTGQNFIENFTYFMYPYEEDVNGNVISSSRWMSDDLCHAILEYSKHVLSKEGMFSEIIDELMLKYADQSDLRTQLFDVETELIIIQDKLDVASINGDPTGDLISQKNSKQTEINNIQSQLDSVEMDIAGLEAEVDELRDELDVPNFYMELFNNNTQLVQQLLEEKRNFEIYRTFENNSYFDTKELYSVAKDELDKYIMPPVNVSMSLVNFLNLVEGQKDWDRIGVGYVLYLTYKNFGISIKSRIIDINIDYEGNSINLSIADENRLQNDEDYFNEMMYRNSSTASNVQANEKWWRRAEEDNSFVRQLLEDGWDANLQQINAGVESEVTINRRGIIIKSPDDPLNYLVARHGILAITNDGGNSFKNAITKNGIIAERVVGQLIAGSELLITNNTGSVQITGDGIAIENGSINWNNVDSDPAIEQGVQEAKSIAESIADGTYSGGTFIDGTSIFSPTIGAGSFIGGDIDIGNGTFRVDNQGNMIANSANIEGNITGSTITGSTISGSNIMGGTITGGIIRTTQHGARIELSNNELIATDRNGTPRIKLERVNSIGGVNHYYGLKFFNENGNANGVILADENYFNIYGGNTGGLVLGDKVFFSPFGTVNFLSSLVYFTDATVYGLENSGYATQNWVSNNFATSGHGHWNDYVKTSSANQNIEVQVFSTYMQIRLVGGVWNRIDFD